MGVLLCGRHFQDWKRLAAAFYGDLGNSGDFFANFTKRDGCNSWKMSYFDKI